MNKIKQIFKTHWKSITFSYLLFTINSLFMLIYPKLLGDLFDGLIKDDNSPIIPFVLCFIGVMVFTYLSQKYDTIVFSRIGNSFISQEVDSQLKRGVDSDKINGRYNLMYSVVAIFETHVTTILSCLYSLIGSVIFICYIDCRLLIPLFLCLLGFLILTKYFTPIIERIINKINNISESRIKWIATGDIKMINVFLKGKRKYEILDSNVNAVYYTLMQFLVYTTVVMSIIFYIKHNTVTVGETFTTYRYLFEFTIAVSYLPHLINVWLNIKDVLTRIEEN